MKDNFKMFRSNIEWGKIRKLIVIILLILLTAYIVIKSIDLNNEYNKKQKIKIETEKSYC